MIRKLLGTLVLATLVTVPGAAGAFSFGVFSPGDRIASIVLSPGAPNPPTVAFTTAANQLQFEAYVSTINMASGGIFNIAAGDVLFSSALMLTGTPFYGFPPYGSGEFLLGSFANGMAADFSIVDLAGGSNLLVEGDYLTALQWKATQGLGTIVSGTLDGKFTKTGGDPDFLAAAIYLDRFNAFMTGFTSDGSTVTNLCGLVLTCPPAGVVSDFDNWEANPNMTINVPEPATGLLVGLAIAQLAAARRRRF